jgi:hypothetical protein
LTARLRHVTVDCARWEPLVEFWSQALDFVEDPDNPNNPGDPEGRTRDDEVDRENDGSGWVVLADPEGNEFCVERSDAERAAAD